MTRRLPARLLAALLAAPAVFAACATPIAPPGGPVDETPPRLVDSVPAADAVNVRADEVVLTFSELLDPASARQAVQITPDPETPPEVEVRGRRLTVRFREPLRDSTTYVVTLGTELSDNHRVRIPSPIPFAFATGPQLDAGRLTGLVRDAHTGAAVAEAAVFAYAVADTLPDPRTAAPDYRTQTGTDGRFELAYLRDAPFFVVVVEDANRNRRADPGERYAVPTDPRVRPTLAAAAAPDEGRADQLPDELEEADDDGLPEPPPLESGDTLDAAADSSQQAQPQPDTADASTAPTLRFWTATLDTLPPVPRSARALNARRVAVRFDEPVRLPDGRRGWAVEDSASGTAVPVDAAYVLPGAPEQVVLQLTADPTPGRPHRVRLDGPAVADSAGNAAAPFARSFSPSSTPDTLALRLTDFLPPEAALVEGALPAGARPGARFSLPPPSDVLAVTDTLGAPLALALATPDGLTFRLAEPPRSAVRLTATLPDTVQSRTFRPAPESARGSLMGTVVLDSVLVVPPGVRVGVEAWPEGAEEPLRAVAGPDGRFALAALPAGAYRLRIWLDLDGDGRWSGGRLAPYRAAEPLLLLAEPERVRARWDTEIEDLVLTR